MGFAVVYEQEKPYVYGVEKAFSTLQKAGQYLLSYSSDYPRRIVELSIDDEEDSKVLPAIPEEYENAKCFQPLTIDDDWMEFWQFIRDGDEAVLVHFWTQYQCPIFHGTVKNFFDNNFTYRREGKIFEVLLIHDHSFKMSYKIDKNDFLPKPLSESTDRYGALIVAPILFLVIMIIPVSILIPQNLVTARSSKGPLMNCTLTEKVEVINGCRVERSICNIIWQTKYTYDNQTYEQEVRCHYSAYLSYNEEIVLTYIDGLDLRLYDVNGTIPCHVGEIALIYAETGVSQELGIIIAVSISFALVYLFVLTIYCINNNSSGYVEI